ncbi:hypothetical protein ABPG74_006032 [Tetrahymena malaccensis]
MSLLVVSGANKVGQGIIRGLHSSGKYEKIVVADVFPKYYYLERYLRFKDTLTENKTKLEEVKLTDKTDLESAIKKASHVVYVTHDYYYNVPSKLNLIKHTATLSRSAGVKRLVAVTPVENDHYGESQAVLAATQSENEARVAFPGLVELKTDLTFGQDSTVVSELLTRLAYGKSIYFKPSAHRISPVHTLNVAEATQRILENNSLQNLRYVARGTESFDWKTIISTLAAAIGKDANLNQNPLENIISPLSDNIVSQTVHHHHYLNLARFINQYQEPKQTEHHELANLGVNNLVKFSEFYKPNSVSTQDFQIKTGLSHWAHCL